MYATTVCIALVYWANVTRSFLLVLVAGCWMHDPPAAEPTQPQPLAVADHGPPGARAHAVRNAGDAPSIELDEALASARAYALEHGVKLDHQYLQGAVFDAAARQWVFDWQVPNAKGGLTIIDVHESGKITINYGE
jgi:hypothetical protein